VLLGAVVTVTHMAAVFALGLTVWGASKYVMAADVYPWLGFGSGVTIAAIGVWQFTRRLATARARRRGGRVAVDGDHGPGGHTHDVPDRITPASLVALGVSGGIVPCPSALVVLLSAIALQRIGFGMVLIAAFSVGLAAVLIAIGMTMLYARRLVDRWEGAGTWIGRLGMVSPVAIWLIGVGIAVQALVAGRVW
jgi:ABC-type nickel/cobalt efflux system permease component RcnA